MVQAETSTEEQANTKPSAWQSRIEGEWHGIPAVFDADGNHVGYNKVYRSSVNENGKTTYYMHTVLDASGTMRARLEFTDFAFGVIDSDENRIYLGPDFIGAGQPYGALVDANYYSPAWTTDLRTTVHVLPDGETQVYSSLLYDGPTIYGTFNGIYKRAFDYHENPDTKARIDAFVASERVNGTKPHMLDPKIAGVWTGEMQVFGSDQQFVGVNRVQMEYAPSSLLRAEQTVTISGVMERRYSFMRHRSGTKHTFEGPDLYGNSIGYGRALYTHQHFFGEPWKIHGREFLIDDKYTMSVVWEFYKGHLPQYMTYGVLTWQPR